MQQPEQTSPITTTTDDWTLLREAAEEIGECLDSYRRRNGNDEVIWIEENDAELIRLLVPKLLDAYADLWELSIALTQAVEQWKSEGQGGKLLVADGQEVRQFGA